MISSPYNDYGVATSSFSDQANSLPQTLRDAATMATFLNMGFESDEFKNMGNFWTDLFPKMYDISDKTKFPAVFQSNHAGPQLFGPRKDDWTKPCPLEWTLEERNEKCISGQEAIYGTEVLSRLGAIKLAVDPGFMFDCHGCIGNYILDIAKTPEVEAEVPTVEPAADQEVPPVEPAADQPSGASFASSYAAAMFATVFYLFHSLS